MEVVAIRKDSRLATHRALDVLRNGGVVIFPTDTVYGVGGDALHPDVLRRVREIKGRPRGKPFPWLIADLRMARRYARFSKEAEAYARRAWPGATTLVLRKRGAETATVALRVPDHPWLRRFIASFGRPIIGTSANRSGEKPARTARAAARILPEADLLLDGGRLCGGPSAVVDWTGSKARTLRLRRLSCGREMKPTAHESGR